MWHAHSVYFLEPVFVHMKQIPDSSEKNDDKLYFFFREKSLDSGGGASPSVLARVGRVCLVSNILLHVTRDRRCTGSSSQFSQSINSCVFFFTEWWGRTEVSCEQMDDFSEGQAGVLCDGRWWGGNLLWWTEWVWFSFQVYLTVVFTICDVLHSSFEIIVPSSGVKYAKYFRYSKCCCVSRDVWVLTHFFSSTPGDVFIQPAQDERNPVVYGVFSTSGYTPAFSFIHPYIIFYISSDQHICCVQNHILYSR